MTTLKPLLNKGKIIIAPGVYDGLSARLAHEAGFPALYLSGYAVSASLLGQPDAGFLNLTHMEDRIRMISGVVDTPLIADADTGFGGALNVEAATRAYERAGAAAIQIEDQVFPKRCGHTKNREVIGLQEAALKIKAAVDARAGKDFLIIARTDARTMHGLDEALRRAEAYLNVGADILFVESPETEEELARIGASFKGTPLVANMVEGGRTPVLPPTQLEELGFAVAIYPLVGLAAAGAGLKASYDALRGGHAGPGALSFGELNRAIGFEEIWAADAARGED